ncbi:hypothetical protein AB5I41_16275 [Sphingomonas sp. MMS24-JH45]
MAGLMLAAMPVAAQKRMPEPVDAAEAAVLPDLAVALAAERPEVAPLDDALLARLPRPTPLRGVVQTIRATALLGEDRNAEAKAAAEEAVRLTPGLAMPRIIASYVLTFVGTPVAAAGYWLEASTLDPEMARQTEEISSPRWWGGCATRADGAWQQGRGADGRAGRGRGAGSGAIRRGGRATADARPQGGRAR